VLRPQQFIVVYGCYINIAGRKPVSREETEERRDKAESFFSSSFFVPENAASKYWEGR
jgi:hypothetical protein